MKSTNKMGFLNSVLFIVFSITVYQSVFHLPFAVSQNVLFPGDELNTSKFLVSPNRNFTLGFFTIFSSKNFTYLGIQYYDSKASVWVANRDIPMIGNGVLLTIDDLGSLKIINGSGTTLFTIFNNQVGTGNNNTRAVLEDSGNFVVYDDTTHENNRILWQSFDYPTNTLLPGMKLGYNLTTKQIWTLTSSLSDYIPASGAFTMRLQKYQNSPQLLIYHRGELYWASGPWRNRTFQFFNLSLPNQFSYTLVSGGSGMYIIFSAIVLILRLSPTGQFSIYNQNMLLNTPDLCYGYQTDNGCVVSTALPDCRSQIGNYKWKDNYIISGVSITDDNSSIGLSDCMKRCWNDCNCRGCSTTQDGTGCITWGGDNMTITAIAHEYEAEIFFVLVSDKPPKDVLIPGDDLNNLNPTSILVSANGMFTLGFFSPSSSDFTYLGIWYTNGYITNKKVWVANRDMPIAGYGVLKIDDLGTLKVVNGSGTTLFNVYSNQVGTGNNNTRAVLEDSANFVVYDENNQSLWQSFDDPADVLIYGMKIGYNLTTKQNWTLTSWLSNQVPASGAFTMSLKHYQNELEIMRLAIFRRGEIYLSLNSKIQNLFDRSLISDASGMYFTFDDTPTPGLLLWLSPEGQLHYGLSNSILTPDFCYGYQLPNEDQCAVSLLPKCRSKSESFQLKIGKWDGHPSKDDDNSSINLSDCMERCWNDCKCVGFSTSNFDATGCKIWNASAQFTPDINGDSLYVLVSDTPDFCYGYQQLNNHSDQCAVSALPKCRSQSESFQLKNGKWDGLPRTHDNNLSISLSDCMQRCWKDCKCVGFNSTNRYATGCMTWDVHAKFIPDGNLASLYVLVSDVHAKKKTWIWILFSVAIGLASVLAALLCYMRIRRHRLKEEERKKNDYIYQLTGSDSFNYGNELEKGIKGAPDVKIFSLKAILAATDNFSNVNKLGQGGYGPVYKGRLFDGREIAIKRLSKISRQGIQEFKSELILISKLQHTNLVRLYGCCIHQGEKMLIYELMPNKSLDFFLFDEDKKEKIDWRVRFNIIEGVAQGLLYLHKYSRMKVIHRDLKVSNVLLDENMNPKIADFGMARIFQPNVTEGTTHRVVGTYGYMALEYVIQGTFSFKSDVFSFGVLIIEIISGKKNSRLYNLDKPLNLIGYAWELWKAETPLELKDEALGESYDLNQLLRTINVGLLCVQENANDRPTMSEVISMLNNEIVDLHSPNQPAFFPGTKPAVEIRSKHLFDNNIQVSANGLTVTTLEAR